MLTKEGLRALLLDRVDTKAASDNFLSNVLGKKAWHVGVDRAKAVKSAACENFMVDKALLFQGSQWPVDSQKISLPMYNDRRRLN